MTDGGSISVTNLDQVLRALGNVEKDVRAAVDEGIKKGGMRIIADAQDNLRHNTSVVTGLLRQSGHVEKDKDGQFIVGFFDTTNKNDGYAYYVEYGRRAGRMPPPDALEEWVYKKLRIRDRKAARAFGWALAKKIAKVGTQPHPFFFPAVKKNMDKINKDIRDAVHAALRRRFK